MRRTVRKVAEKMGRKVLEATDGTEALAVARHNQSDLIFLDMVMPMKNGLETLQELRSDKCFRTTPVTLLTVLVDKVVVRKAVAVQVHDYLV